ALKRIKDLKSIKDHLLPAFSDDEMKELKKLEEFEKAIKREGDNCFSYKEYKLPEPRFEACVFLDRCGVENLDNPEYFRDKDIIDAGAFIGDSALIFSELTNGKVYSFEPTGENYESLLKTIELNGLKNVEACNYALGAEKGTADMTNAIVSSTNSYVEKSRMPYTATESVKVIRLDDFVRKHGLNVGLIKTDVEGAEQLLLKGAMETIKSQRPTLLISIYHNTSDFYDIKPMLEGLDLGYTFKIRHPAIGTVLMETMLIAEVKN
ncbi:MAG: FkbM family methyltransferase, partial [Butyrivibrio sp.]|nr:FkbM family methyltransferase [Butyrivibrio sp.]